MFFSEKLVKNMCIMNILVSKDLMYFPACVSYLC